MFAGDSDRSLDGEWIFLNTHPLPAFNFEPVVRISIACIPTALDWNS
jgi:hypothetical protein